MANYDAEYYERHKDDASLWGKPSRAPKRHKQGGRLSATITVRFIAEESEAIRRYAKAHDLTYSEVVRRATQCFTAAPVVTFSAGNGGTVTGLAYRPR